MKLIVTLGFFAIAAGGGLPARAQDELPPEPKPTPESVLINQKLVDKVEQVEKSSLRVRSEDDGRTYHALSSHSFAAKSQFVYFRRRGTRLQMIAMGVVEGERKNPADGTAELVINVDKDSIVKYPQVGDLAVPLADPMATNLADKQDNSDTPVAEEKPKGEKPEPGYLEAAAGLMFGRLASDGTSQVGGGKNSGAYRFLNLHFEYFSGLFPIGVSYDSHSGRLPTSPYDGSLVSSNEKVSHLNFYYRFKPLWDRKLLIAARVFQLNDLLTTDNTGSELFTTKIGAMGAGARVQYRFASDVWKPAGNASLGFTPLNVFAELGFSPFVSAVDAGPSRGTESAGSTLLEYRLGASALFWVQFIPVLKRWIVQGSYGSRNYSLKFQGPTISETGNPIPVAEGLSMHESEKDYRFFVGVRFNDPLESLFSGSGKEDKKGAKK